MKLFQCPACGNAVHFENSRCVACGARLGYDPQRRRMAAVDAGAERALCANAQVGVCNWLAPREAGQTLCLSCRHNRLAPDLSIQGNLERWARVEKAKRHLFYSLLQWRLPAPTAAEGAPEPLIFDLVGDIIGQQGQIPILTGHDFGLITLNIAEADDDERERRRVAMREPYRTLLGHFRHEIGHYYWDILVRDGDEIAEFRALFGDERMDYGQALQAYYARGAAAGWEGAHISAYASSHPWEDFAETWAHVMHIVDTLETANSFGVSLTPRQIGDEALKVEVRLDAYAAGSIDELLRAWTPVSLAINSLSRSLGQADAWPFVLSQPITDKLAFVHRLIAAQGARRAAAAE